MQVAGQQGSYAANLVNKSFTLGLGALTASRPAAAAIHDMPQMTHGSMACIGDDKVTVNMEAGKKPVDEWL